MADLELRRELCVALDWILYNYETDCLAQSDADWSDAFTNDGWVIEDWDRTAEAWTFQPEIEPGVSEPWFIDWCAKNGYSWYLTGPHAEAHCIVRLLHHSAISASQSITATGATPSEARARCVVAAVKAKEKV